MAEIKELYEHFLKARAISTDSRNIAKGSIFFALKGDKFDGNSFAPDALKKGAALAVVDDHSLADEAGIFKVSDVLASLQELAMHHRNTLNIPVIGLTGTNGKTSTKELIREVLQKKYRVCATEGNLNNHIGVPLSLLSIAPDAEIAVVEMGANHIGEIADLCRMAMPTHGLITNIGKAHLEGFGSFEGVIKAKSELYDHLKQTEGTVFVNIDDPLLTELAPATKRHTYGQSEKAEVKGSIHASVPFLNIDYNGIRIHTQLYGDYNFWNIMAAIAIGAHFDVHSSDMQKAIAGYQPTNNRSQVVKKGSNTIFLDAYNANPSSMQASIRQFMMQEGEKKVFILGDMLELGAYSDEEHKKVIALLNEQDAQVLLVGTEFIKACTGKPETIFPTTEEAAAWIKEHPIYDAHILIKGSRGIALENLLEYL